MVQDFLHTDQIAYSSEGELPDGLIMPAGQICYEKETLCNAYKMGAFCYIYDSALLCSLFAEGMGRAEIASGYKYNLTLFTEIRRYWRYLGHFDSLGWIAFLNIIGNVLAFIPFGIFVPWLSNGRINVFSTFAYGFALSLTIETVQLICKVGCFDVDDLVLNVLGALCGYAVYAIAYRIVKMFSKKDR